MSDQPEQRQGYRPDIDGLRAVAVLGVIVFHLNPAWLPGGFLGVDVFFVISGYLITGILMRETEAGGIRFGEFWKRRVRRLLPAFAFMAVGTCLLAALFFPPTLAFAAAKQTLAASCGVSNWYLSQLTSNYWGQIASWAPLLHTWSLSVEEQFYLAFPFVFYALTRARSSRLMVFALLAIAIASGVASACVEPANAARVFFLPFGRAWELLAGAIGALMAARLPRLPLVRWAAFAGLCLIGISFAATDGKNFTAWPSASPAVLGSLLICCFGEHATAAVKFMSAAPMRWIGRASYSIYLWHWPALVFGSTLALAYPSGMMREAALAVGIVAGALSYLYVEPLGRGPIPVAKWAPVLAGLTFATAFAILQRPGPPTWKIEGGRDNPDIQLRSPALLLVGDSHAEVASRALRLAANAAGMDFAKHTDAGLAIVPGRAKASRERVLYWEWAHKARTALVANENVSTVVVICRWESYPADQDLAEIETILCGWRALRPTAGFVLVQQAPRLDIGCFRALEWRDWLRSVGADQVVGTRRRIEIEQRLSAIAAKCGAQVVSSSRAIGFEADSLRGGAPVDVLRLYHDDNHLSEAGAEMVVRDVMLAIAKPPVRR